MIEWVVGGVIIVGFFLQGMALNNAHRKIKHIKKLNSEWMIQYNLYRKMTEVIASGSAKFPEKLAKETLRASDALIEDLKSK